ncbi:putative mediator of RNA polymerase II transcription subunit 26 isoform X1 [Wyeomyia smithii]|uniref:putative mediator of RNA polymerase II transcription subunit 26 isoform X1 n=1 Tax=Wyeomyia smithii TaxID=174621 RepID=UPI002467FAA1|nr:putative mediator of RNA polymerase II transcription subunit 26 isoform X1 [Wyeomyia smithii]
MRAIVLISVLCAGLATAFPQQAIDPAYLRQYYQQIAQQAVAQESLAEPRADATPIYEQGAQEQQHIPQYLQQGQQIRLRDNVQDQIQRQFQQPQQQQVARQYQPQYQPQQVQYVQEQQYTQPKQLKVSKPRPAQQYQSLGQGGGQRQLDEDEDFDANPSYQFGFDVKDDEYTNYQNRKEQREGNVIKGSYSVVDSDGFIRTVTYTADPKEGFRAEVSRQPTDIVVKIPKPNPEYQQQQIQQHRVQAQQPQKPRPDYTQYQ